MELCMQDSGKAEIVGLTADIVAAYVSNNPVATSDLPALISEVYGALSRVVSNMPVADREELKPAISVKRSVTPEYIVCLEDGKKFKSLKRHLRTHYNLSPEEYREKWGLPHDYPMVAPNYAAARSELAKKMGLGTRKG
jgi:predicted transcriptional regulator